MTQPDLPQFARIAERYGLAVPGFLPVPWTGAMSRVYPCGDVVVKVAFETPAAMHAVRVDAAMSPVARDLGVRVPELVAFDDTCELLPVPFAVFRRVREAVPLSECAVPRHVARSAWEDVGRNLALLHRIPHGTPVPLLLREFRQSPDVDPRRWVDELRDWKRLDADDASWLHRLLDALAPAALGDVPLRLCHGDVNAANVLVPSTPGSGVVLIDWAGTGWLDPVWDFAGVPLEVVPFLLAGHRSVAPLPGDDTAEMRMCWCQAQTRLLAARSHTNDASAIAGLQRDVSSLRAFAATQPWLVG